MIRRSLAWILTWPEKVRFIVDECTGTSLAAWLERQGHDVFSVFDTARGASDSWVLEKAFLEKRILVTNDKGFGERVFRSRSSHHGVVLLRLADETPGTKRRVFEKLLHSFSNRLERAFVVATENKARIVLGGDTGA